MQPICIMLVGPQGSGKSTYCQQNLKNYVRISQDDQGKHGHWDMFLEAIGRQQDVVVDRINFNKEQRGRFIAKAKIFGYYIKIVWLNIDKPTCIARIKSRKDHPTLQGDKAEEALNFYFSRFQAPSKAECHELTVIGNKPYYITPNDICGAIGDKRYCIVGDIHGTFDEFKTLLDKINFNPETDVLISTGDLVDRGPKIKEVLDYCRSLPNFYAVMGNHEDKLIRKSTGRNVKIGHGLQETLDAYGGKLPQDVFDWLQSFSLILKVPDGYVVHAGFEPSMTPDEQFKADCIFMRFTGGKNYFDNIDGVLWRNLWNQGKVFFGHNPDSTIELNNTICLDGGCVFGGDLRIWDSKDKQVHSITAFKQYAVSEYTTAVAGCFDHINKRNEYVLAGLLRKDISDDGELVIFNYTDQCTYEQAWDEITTNSRGVVYNLKTGEKVACPMPKFFNLGEREDTAFNKFDWTKPYQVFTKLDGCLGTLIRHNGKFEIASRGSFHSTMSQWATKFIQTKDLSCLPNEVTLCFEIISNVSKIILDYGNMETLVILAAFNRFTGEEYSRQQVEEWSKQIDIPIVDMVPMSIYDCLEKQKTLTGEEGWVIRFEDGRRVKVKTEWYLELAKIMSNTSPISLWEIMKDGRIPLERMMQIPEEIRPLAESIKNRLEYQYDIIKENLINKCKIVVAKYGTDKKTLGLNIKNFSDVKSAVFSYINGQSLDKLIMNEIYPRANEFKSITKDS